MSISKTVIPAIALAALLPPAAAMAQPAPAAANSYSSPYRRWTNPGPSVLADDTSFFDTYVKGRLHLGFSYSKISMDKTSTPHEKSFLGNLDTLREEDTSALGISLKYDINDYFAILFANDIDASLSAWNYTSASTDGDLELEGFTLNAIAQYPIQIPESKVTATPFIGIGIADVSASWRHQPWWHWGWSSPESYENNGGEAGDPHNGYSRWMLPEDPSAALVLTLGVSCTIAEHLDLDISYRTVDLDDISTEFRTYSKDGPLMAEGAFPAKFTSLNLALRYVF